MRASNFANTVLGEATMKAVDSVSGQLNSKSASLPTKAVTISALVADASPDGTVIINVGSRGGVKVGIVSKFAAKSAKYATPPPTA